MWAVISDVFRVICFNNKISRTIFTSTIPFSVFSICIRNLRARRNSTTNTSITRERNMVLNTVVNIFIELRIEKKSGKIERYTNANTNNLAVVVTTSQECLMLYNGLQSNWFIVKKMDIRSLIDFNQYWKILRSFFPFIQIIFFIKFYRYINYFHSKKTQ